MYIVPAPVCVPVTQDDFLPLLLALPAQIPGSLRALQEPDAGSRPAVAVYS
jgi:hypothetical protein